jgi:hypothetical protein
MLDADERPTQHRPTLRTFIKVHDGNEPLSECSRLYDELAASSKKMVHNDGGWNFFMASKPKCELFIIENKNREKFK